MSDTKVRFDKGLVTVDNNNLLEKKRKEYRDVLAINAFIWYVEVPAKAAADSPKEIVKAAEEAVEECESQLFKCVDQLGDELRKLQKGAGGKKAVAEAQKLLKAAEKKIKDFSGDFNVDIRKAVQKAVAKITGDKTQLSSVGRTTFRGIKLEKEAFPEAEEDEEAEAPKSMKDAAKQLAAVGKRISELANEEKEVRAKFVKEIKDCWDSIKEAMGKDKDTFDLKKHQQGRIKELRPLLDVYDKYAILNDNLDKALDKASKSLKMMDKSVKSGKDDGEGEKELKKKSDDAADDFAKAHKVIEDAMAQRWSYLMGAGPAFAGLSDEVKKIQKIATDLPQEKSFRKSAETLADAGKTLDSLAKG